MKKFAQKLTMAVMCMFCISGAYAFVPVTGITVDKNSFNPGVGESQGIVVTIQPSNATNKFFKVVHSDVAIAEYDRETGKITGHGGGKATITFTTEDGNHSKTVEVSVTKNVPALTGLKIVKGDNSSWESGSFSGSSGTVIVGVIGKCQLAIVPTPAAASRSVVWSSSNTGVLKIRQDGTMEALATAERVIITATSVDNPDISTSVEMTVINPVSPTALAIQPQNITLIRGMESHFQVALDELLPPAGISISWTSEDPSIATVDNLGRVTAVSPGQTEIIASIVGLEPERASVTVQDSGEFPTIFIPQGLKKYDEIKLMCLNPRKTVSSVKWSINDFPITGTTTYIRKGENKIKCEVRYQDNSYEVIIKYINRE